MLLNNSSEQFNIMFNVKGGDSDTSEATKWYYCGNEGHLAKGEKRVLKKAVVLVNQPLITTTRESIGQYTRISPAEIQGKAREFSSNCEEACKQNYKEGKKCRQYFRSMGVNLCNRIKKKIKGLNFKHWIFMHSNNVSVFFALNNFQLIFQ